MPRFVLMLLLVAGSASSVTPWSDPLPPWITVDSGTRTVVLSLEVGATSPEGLAGLNAHHHGDIQLVVPLGWSVTWTWINRDSVRSHSLVVMAEREKLPMAGGRPDLENAMTRAVTTGLKPGQRDVTTFIAEQAGWYWMLCGVPGHAIAGEWIGLKVDREAAGVGVVLKD